jgi:hypothetical protein
MALSPSYRGPRSVADRMDRPHSRASSGRANTHRPVPVSSWGSRHPLFCVLLLLIAGFAIMHVVFVGGQSGPLLRSSPRISLQSETLPLATMPAKRAYTQLNEPTVTGSLVRTRRPPSATHPLPPPRPKRF